MGQNVEVNDRTAMGEVLVLDTDRSFTGQDGVSLSPGSVGSGFTGMLADQLFALDLDIDHVFVMQNTVTVRRPGGWDEDSAGLVSEVTERFLLHYGDEEE